MSVTDVNNFINNHCEKVLKKKEKNDIYNECVTLNNKIEKKRKPPAFGYTDRPDKKRDVKKQRDREDRLRRVREREARRNRRAIRRARMDKVFDSGECNSIKEYSKRVECKNNINKSVIKQVSKIREKQSTGTEARKIDDRDKRRERRNKKKRDTKKKERDDTIRKSVHKRGGYNPDDYDSDGNRIFIFMDPGITLRF